MPVKVLCHAPGGVEIRTLHRGLADRIYQIVEMERSHLGQWLPWVSHTHSVADTMRFLRSARDAFLHGEGVHGAIWFEGALVGMIALRVVSKSDGVGNVGYWLRESAQGKGIVTRAVSAFAAHCFEDWNLYRLELLCADGNAKSCRVAERVGFRYEGIMRGARVVNGEHVDMRLYSLLEPEWRLAQRERGRA